MEEQAEKAMNDAKGDETEAEAKFNEATKDELSR